MLQQLWKSIFALEHLRKQVTCVRIRQTWGVLGCCPRTQRPHMLRHCHHGSPQASVFTRKCPLCAHGAATMTVVPWLKKHMLQQLRISIFALEHLNTLITMYLKKHDKILYQSKYDSYTWSCNDRNKKNNCTKSGIFTLDRAIQFYFFCSELFLQ